MALERLHKFMARAGVGSRRRCERLIVEGRVAVNGRVVRELGTRIDPTVDRVYVDGVALRHEPARPICIMMYKPRGVITTVRDPDGRRTVMDLLGRSGQRVYPVGRLDRDSEGLLLLTNDGELAFRLTHPRFGVKKTYEVVVEGCPDEETLSKLRSGVRLEEGVTAPAEVDLVECRDGATLLRFTIHQGWNRQIRRMCEAVGHPVVRLKRTGYAFLSLGTLKPGQYRLLSKAELRRLRGAAGIGSDVGGNGFGNGRD